MRTSVRNIRTGFMRTISGCTGTVRDVVEGKVTRGSRKF